MPKTSERTPATHSSTPRDIPMPAYRYQQDSGSARASTSRQPREASGDLLRGCNLGG